MRSFLDKEDTIYTAGKRFSYKNIMDEDFVSMWGGVKITVPSHKTIEISDKTPFVGAGLGECLAIKMTREQVDKIKLGQANAVRDEVDGKGKPVKSERIAATIRIPFQREELEKMILTELEPEDEATLRFLGDTKIKEITVDSEKQAGVAPATGASVFVDWDNVRDNFPSEKPVK